MQCGHCSLAASHRRYDDARYSALLLPVLTRLWRIRRLSGPGIHTIYTGYPHYLHRVHIYTTHYLHVVDMTTIAKFTTAGAMGKSSNNRGMQTSADQTTAVHCRLQCLGAAQHTRDHIFSVNLPGFLLCGGGDGGDGLGAAVGDCQDVVAEIHSNKMIMSARFTARADIYHIWCTGQPIFMGSLSL